MKIIKIALFLALGITSYSYAQSLKTNLHEASSLTPVKNNLNNNPHLIYLDANKLVDLPVDGAFLYSSLNPESGIISSGYNNNEDYTLTIKNQYQRKIFLRSHYFSTENTNDVLTIYDGKDTSSKIIKSISGYLDENFSLMSTGEYLTLHFKSNNSSTSKGFRFRVDNGPGINGNQGVLPNPMACASTAASNECANSPLICDLNGYCGNTSSAYTAGNTSGLGNFCGSIENNSWLSFVASGTSASLAFNSAGCQDNSSGIQAVIYASSNCTSFTEVSNCESQGSASGSFTITTNVALVPGQTYYVMVDGFAGNVCSYTVGAQAGVALGQQLTGPNQLCPGFSGVLGSSSAASSYAWSSTPPGVYPNTQTITITPTVTTTYTLTMGPSACTPTGITIVKTVTVTNTLNPANITAPNPICMGTSVNLSSLTNGGTYAWTGPGGYTATGQNANIPNWTTANNGVYSLVITYGPGCATAPASVTLTGTPSPTITLTAAPSLTICSGQSVVLTSAGGTGISGYTWNWNPLQTSATTEFCITIPIVGTQCNPSPLSIPGISAGSNATFTPNQTTQICVSGNNSAGCGDSFCTNIVVLPAAAALTISPTSTICPGQNTSLTISGGTTYTWSPSATLSSANGATVTANPTITTVYTVSTTVCGGTIVTRTVQVTVNGSPPTIGAISGSSIICPNSTGITYSVTNVASTNYTWSVPAGATITSAPTNSNAITINFGATAGTVSVTAVGTCGTATASLNVSLSPALNLSVTPNTSTVCAGSSVTLTASGATNYTWSPAATLSSANGASVVASPTIATVYTIIGANGTCTGTTTASIAIGGVLTLSVTPNTSTVCPGTPVVLTASGATNYTWSPSATLSSVNGATVTATPLTGTTYTVIGATGTCTGSATANISMSAGLTLTLTSNTPTICPGGSALLDVNGATTYTWFPSSSLSSANGSNVTASPLVNTTYTVLGSTGTCTGVATVNVGIGVCVSSACNLALIRSTLTAAGNIELLGMNNTCSLYFINPQYMTGPQAQAYAQTFGANLISVQSATENADLVQALSNQGYSSEVVWIGYTDIVTEGSYVWYDGAPLSYSNWAPGEPNNAGDEDCTQIYPDGSWNDLTCAGYNSLSVIEVNICPQISVVNVPPTHCPFTNVTMNASTLLGSPNYTYTWVQSGTATFTTSSTGSSLNDQIIVTSTGANTFTVFTEDRYSCPQSTTVSLNVFPSPTITVNSASICLGQQTATLTANGAATYTWIPGTGLSSTTGAVVTGTPSSTQNYTVIGMDANGCLNGTLTAININPLPTITINSASICIGQQTATLTANGANTYSWTPSTGLSASTGSLVTGTPLITQSYSVTGTDINGCFSGNTSTITVNSLPIITANSASICIGQQTATLTANGATTYSWIPATGLSATNVAVVTGTPNTTQSYTVAGMDANGCINGTVTAITVNTLPTVTVNSSTICVGQQTATLTANGADTYTWSAGLSSLTGSVVTGNPVSTQNYTVTGTDLNGCFNATTTAVNVNPLPTLVSSPNTTVCPLSANTLTVGGAASYTWSPNIYLNTNIASNVICTPSVTTTYTIDGTSTAACTNSTVLTIVVNNTVVVNASATTPTICPLGSTSLTASGASSYTWSPALTLSSANGATVTSSTPISETYTVIGATSTCTNSQIVVVTVTVNPTINVASTPSIICSGASSNLTASGANTYTWLPSSTLNTSNGSVVIASPNNTTIYTINGTSPLGCLGSTTTTLVVIPTPTISTIGNPLTICAGNSSTLSAFGASSYAWSPAGSLSNINGSPTIATPAFTTTYTVIGTNGTAPFQCSRPSTVVIVVTPNTTITPGTDMVICAGQQTTIYATGGTNYTWTPSVGISNPNDATIDVQPSTTTVYTVTGTDNNVCPGTATVQVIVNPLPVVNAGLDTTINIDNTVTLFGTGNVEVGFLSPDGIPLSCNYCSTITVNPQDNTCYTLEGINQYGCRNTDVVCVTVTKDWDVFIPNAFTPNGDVINEIFIPVGYAISEINLQIFDRWGHQIFKSHGDVVGWDGTNKGKLCEQGVYIYKAEITAMSGEKRYKTGHVTLLPRIK